MQGTQQAPRTVAELETMYRLRGELEEQIKNVTRRHGQLVQERHNAQATGNLAVVAEHDARIKELSGRLSRLEGQKLRADDLITDAMSRGVGQEAGHVPPPPEAPTPPPVFPQTIVEVHPPSSAATFIRDNAVPLLLGEALLFVVAGVALWRLAITRALKGKPVPGLGQLNTSVDAIALEVERISENQRYVTKLLNEKLLAPGEAAAQPLEMREKTARP